MSADGIAEIIVGGCMMAAYAIEDVVTKRIVMWHLLIGLLVMLPISIVSDGFVPLQRAGGLAIGLIIVLLSKVTHEGIGMADGLLLCVTGVSLGISKNFYVFSIGVFIAGIYAGIMLFLGKLGRRDSLPLIPFLFIGYVCSVFMAA